MENDQQSKRFDRNTAKRLFFVALIIAACLLLAGMLLVDQTDATKRLQHLEREINSLEEKVRDDDFNTDDSVKLAQLETDVTNLIVKSDDLSEDTKIQLLEFTRRLELVNISVALGTTGQTGVQGPKGDPGATGPMGPAGSGTSSAIYGDGSDGSVTISSDTTLSRDMAYDTLMVTNNATLFTGSYKIYCSTSCTIDSGSRVVNSGNAAAGSSAGIAAPTGSIFSGINGGAGGITTGSASTGGFNNAGSGSGGAGGAGSGGAGGTGNTIPSISAVRGGPKAIVSFVNASSGWIFGQTAVAAAFGGGGGGGGGGNGSLAGGGGGGGSGGIILSALRLVNNGTIQALGGDGASASNANTGGGGGAAGGVIHLIYGAKSGSGTISVVGGQAGAGNGTGTAGVAGTSGTVREYRL